MRRMAESAKAGKDARFRISDIRTDLSFGKDARSHRLQWDSGLDRLKRSSSVYARDLNSLTKGQVSLWKRRPPPA